MKTITGLIALIITFNIQANDDRPAKRFTKYLKKIEKTVLANKYSDDLTDAMIANDLRDIFFKVEALTRIYKNQDPLFSQMHIEFKDFEDDLGSWEKWDSIYRKSGNSKFLAKRQRAWGRIRNLISNYKWQTKHGNNMAIFKYINGIENYNFGGYFADKQFVTGEIANQIDILDSKDFDLTYLEKGNGLHELRKEIRWILHEIRNLRGLIQYAPENQCPIDDFRFLTTSSARNLSYAQIKNSQEEVDPCFISMCTYLSLAKAVDDLGEMKDKIEVLININGTQDQDLTPPKYKKKAQKIYDLLKRKNVLGIVSSELKACQ